MTLDQYKKISFWPVNVMSIVFLFIFCATNFHIDLAENNVLQLSLINYFIWAFFIIDYFWMLMLATDKRLFFKTHLAHLIVVAVPFLRVLRVGLLVLVIVNALGNLKNRILISIPVFTSVATGLFVLIGASAVFDAEYKAEGSNIRTPQDAFWWAAVTIFTVGYGDRFPVTGEGRLYGVMLMICGIAIVGTVTATFAGWLISQIREVESENQKIISKLEAIEKKL